MDKWYWDTSAFLKLYCPESDSAKYIELATQSEGLLLSSQILEIEFYYALQQKQVRGEITPNEANTSFGQFSKDIQNKYFELIPFSQTVTKNACTLWELCSQKPKPTLRSLDGLHLATATMMQCKFLVTAVTRMQKIAVRAGMIIPEICYS